MKDSSAEMVLRGALEFDDVTIIRDLGKQRAKDIGLRVSSIVDKLIFHHFGNYVL